VIEILGGNEMTIGILYAATGLMIFLSSSLWGKFFDKLMDAGYQIHGVISLILFFSALLQVLHAYATTVIFVFFLRLMWGICLGAVLPVLLRLLIEHTEDNKKGARLGCGSSATKIGELIGIASGAFIQTQMGYQNNFFMMALLYVIAGAFILAQMKSDSVLNTEIEI
jgi:predicted MFS family arabinose efflux permease